MQQFLLSSPACRRGTTLGPLPVSQPASSRIGVSRVLGDEACVREPTQPVAESPAEHRSITAFERAPQRRALVAGSRRKKHVVNFLRLSHTDTYAIARFRPLC